MEETAKTRKIAKVGTVVSAGMDKTVVVSVQSVVIHKLYHRFVKRSRKFMAHDEANTCKVGDRVRIRECRPISKDKCWRVVAIVARQD